MIAVNAFSIFNQAISEYHLYDSIDQEFIQPKNYNDFEKILYLKNWIDTVQWHCEDIIRNPTLEANEGIKLKRRIDALNQQRTDLVEQIDDFFLEKYKSIVILNEAYLNTESPAWALDRLSILALKIFHMKQEVDRKDILDNYKEIVSHKLAVLLTQQEDLIHSIDILLANIAQGKIIFKVYRQMKMYNDAEMNPVLRQHLKI